jgi:hypothetical protein
MNPDEVVGLPASKSDENLIKNPIKFKKATSA